MQLGKQFRIGNKMRPIKLVLRNIGPYENAEIDFTQLENIFLIAGNTGAGKTFIFDAMTFALYGQLRGNRSGKEKDLKSRYASPKETEFFVEFTFKIARDVFKVRRTVPFTKEGNKTETASSVSLLKMNSQTESFEDFIKTGRKGTNEINKKIEQIIGLSANEFSQIVLLPQGEFAEFLKQNTREKQKTLEKLFPVEDYKMLLEKAKEKAEDYEIKISKLKTIIDAELHSASGLNFDFENAEEKISSMKEELALKEKKENELNEKLKSFAAEKIRIENELQAARKNENNLKLKTELEGQKHEIETAENEIALAEKANELKDFINNARRTKAALENARLELDSSRKNFDAVKAEKEKLECEKEKMELLNRENEKNKTNLDIIHEKISRFEEYNAALKNETILKEEKETLEKNLSSVKEEISLAEKDFSGSSPDEKLESLGSKIVELTSQKNNLENLITRCDEKEKYELDIAALEQEKSSFIKKAETQKDKAERTANTLQQKKDRLENFKIENAAYFISTVLEAGKKCPVCGSTEHPETARKPEQFLNIDEEISIFEEALKKENRELEETNKILTEIETKISEKKLHLQNFSSLKPKSEIMQEYDLSCRKLDLLSDEKKSLVMLKEKIERLIIQKEKTETEFNRINLKYENSKTKRETLEKEAGGNFEELKSQYGTLLKTYEDNANLYAAWIDDLSETRTKYAAAESSVKEKKSVAEKTEAEKNQSEILLGEKLSASVFATPREAEDKMLSLSEIDFKRKKCNSYHSQLQSVTDALLNAEKTLPYSELEKKYAALETENEKCRNELEQTSLDLNEARKNFTTYSNSWEKICSCKNSMTQLENESLPARKLYEHLSGKNFAGVAFDTWALGMYFEQVVEFASNRFFEISSHRFEFVLKDVAERKTGNGYRGLDLLVIDHNTPNSKYSDTSDLSGGETFEASISLALAITDVVQNNSGGISLDSLFIDEGFGTLDSEPLESTMKVLEELSETKMIGLISHVDSLQNSKTGITSRITVNKTDHGSTVSVS